MSAAGMKTDDSYLTFSSGIWVHPDFHSSLASSDRQQAVNQINQALQHVRKELQDTTYLFITLGTSIVYRWKKTDKIVANCHKLPTSEFTRESVSAQEGAGALAEAFAAVKKINPDIRIILTVSPVRHVRDGLVANTRSKARLFEMIDILEATDAAVSYFPAYEWLMDDLRDYRYYGADLIHPNDQAIEFIWEKFSSHYFNSDTSNLNMRIDKVLTGLAHRPFNPDTDEHRAFVSRLSTEIKELETRYPWLKF